MATSYIEITDLEIDPEAPFTNSLCERFRDNPIAIAQISSGAPPIAQKVDTQILSGSGTWVVPADVYSVRVYMSGGGGGGTHAQSTSTDANNGGSTSFMGVTASGGRAGDLFPASITGTGLKPLGAPGGRGIRNGTNGGAGESEVFVMTVSPGQSYSYSVGGGGAGSTVLSESAGRGANGFIRLEY